ncbi:MAG: CoA-binding protein, partial [Rhodospirillales bacterium]|nr:CoA-binding protein [Rhodospirillales bacterium]
MQEDTSYKELADDSFSNDSANIIRNAEEKENEAGIGVVLKEIGAFARFAGLRFGEDRCLRMA